MNIRETSCCLRGWHGVSFFCCLPAVLLAEITMRVQFPVAIIHNSGNKIHNRGAESLRFLQYLCTKQDS